MAWHAGWLEAHGAPRRKLRTIFRRITDFLEQFIDYKVPVDMFSKLAEYDGSVIAERTKGELSARCGGTSMNFVAINLAHEIITGRRTVAEARDEYTRLYTAFKARREACLYPGISVLSSERRYERSRRDDDIVARGCDRGPTNKCEVDHGERQQKSTESTTYRRREAPIHRSRRITQDRSGQMSSRRSVVTLN